MDGMKTCKICETEKPLSEYTVRKIDGWRHNKCNQCRASEELARHRRRRRDNPVGSSLTARKAHLKRKFGLTVERYEEMLAAQGGTCALCGGSDPKAARGGAFAVDHCHETGKVRALLCSPCNKGIGLLGDDPDRLLAAAMYLMRHQNTLEKLLPGMAEG
jgi:hypothetical protein